MTVIEQDVSLSALPSLLDQAWRLEPFVHPFTFSAFFSPEDTLLCVNAAEAAHREVPGARVVELTSGSGLVGFYLLQQDPDATLLGLDVDADAARVAASNARLLGLDDRAEFLRSDLWSDGTLKLLAIQRPNLLVCNPPYVPEPPSTSMQIEAGSGPRGTAHLLRTLELARIVQPEALALSWCSLSDPIGIVTAAENSGYALSGLYVSAIADGEYSGSVRSYLRDLDDCFINEQAATLTAIASDGSARFAYLLLAAAFRRGESPQSATPAVRAICQNFARHGLRALEDADAPFPVHCSVLNRWDELKLRVLLHGQPDRSR